MRSLSFVVFALLAACELEPAPKQQPPQAQAVEPTRAPEPAAKPVPAPENAPGSAAAPTSLGDDCVAAGVRFAQVQIDSEKDASMKAQMEQERTNIVKRIAEVCIQMNWSQEARSCFKAATTSGDIVECRKKVPEPAPQPAQPPAAQQGSAATPPARPVPVGGSGSGAQKRPEPGAVQGVHPERVRRPPQPKTGSGSAANR